MSYHQYSSRATPTITSNMTKEYYHYTDQPGYDGILESGVILPSECFKNDDAVYGDGVYLTDMPPSKGKEAIADCCWDNVAHQAKQMGKLEYVIIVSIPNGELHETPNPRVFLYKDGPLDLRQYNGRGERCAWSLHIAMPTQQLMVAQSNRTVSFHQSSASARTDISGGYNHWR